MRRERMLPGDVRIDRATIYGNPFRIGRDGTRAEVIAKYERMIRDNLKKEHDYGIEDTQEAIKDLRGRRLFCWCAPAPCHGNVLERICEELHKKGPKK